MSAYEEVLSAVPEGLQGVIITDCNDANARVRQQVRFRSLFGVTPAFIELGSEDPDLEASGHLVDVLDGLQTPAAFPSTPAVVLVNVAPRGDDVRKKWENGTPFCYTETVNTTIVSTYEGRALSLARKLGLAGTVNLLDIPEVNRSLVERGLLTPRESETIRKTQFRSLEFLPLAARLLVGKVALPAEKLEVDEHPKVDSRAWFADNFGNLKTTVLPGEIGFEEGRTARVLQGQEVTFHRHLTDVPSGEFALTVGSSGYGENRWLELVQQKGSAAEKLQLGVGSRILEV